jgi:hypothetical protein
MAGTIFLEARHRGTKTFKRKPWNQHFSSGRGKFYALVHNAAYDYYTRVVPTYGLKMPRKCRISAKYNLSGRSEHRADILTLLPTSDIRVNRKKGGAYQGSDGIYAATVHELTHAGHRELDPGMFNIFHIGNCERLILMESWAEGAETILTNDRYDRFNSIYYNDVHNSFTGWNSGKQHLTVSEMSEYTPIVIDLVDECNQNLIPGINGVQPVDNVSGYTLSTIQATLKNCRTLNSWFSKLNNTRPKWVTTVELSELFSYLEQVQQNTSTCDN